MYETSNSTKHRVITSLKEIDTSVVDIVGSILPPIQMPIEVDFSSVADTKALLSPILQSCPLPKIKFL